MSLLEAIKQKKSGLKATETNERAFDPSTLNSDSDSLTWGYIGPFGMEQHPYANKLAELIKNDFSEQPSVEIIAKGVNGERTQKMAERLADELKKDSDFDAIILLGVVDVCSWNINLIILGTNDVGDKTPEKTLENLKNMQSTAAKYKIDFFIGTLPPAKPDDIDWVLDVKTKINDGVKKLVPESRLNDFSKEIPMHELTEEERDKLWSDHLHLTAAGYDMMAEVIYKKLKVALQEHKKQK